MIGQQLEIVTHDSQYDMNVTAQVAKQYVEEDGVEAFIGYTDTDSVLASGFVFQAAGIPYITVGATSPKLPTQVGDLLFLASFGDNVQAAAGAEYAFENFGDTAYLLLDKGQTYTTLLAEYFKDAFTELRRHDRRRGLLRERRHRLRGADREGHGAAGAPAFYYMRRCPTTSASRSSRCARPGSRPGRSSAATATTRRTS